MGSPEARPAKVGHQGRGDATAAGVISHQPWVWWTLHMTVRTYSAPASFKQALEQRLRSSASGGTAFARKRQLLVFDRFLARLVAHHPAALDRRQATVLMFCPRCAGRLAAGVAEAINVSALDCCASIAFFSTKMPAVCAVRCCESCVARPAIPEISMLGLSASPRPHLSLVTGATHRPRQSAPDTAPASIASERSFYGCCCCCCTVRRQSKIKSSSGSSLQR